MDRWWLKALFVLAAAGLATWFLWAAFFWAPEIFAPRTAWGQTSELAKVLIGVFISAAGFIVLVLVQPLKDALAKAVTDVVGVVALPACRVFIFGYPSTGKTSLIRRLVALRQDGDEPSTKGFHVYEMSAPLNLESNRKIKVLFADYEGASTDELFVNPPAYFAFAGRRHVNILVFLVDMFKAPPIPRGTGVSTKDYAKRVLTEIDERVTEDVERYITPQTIKLAMKISGTGDKLCAVRLLINKIDILREHAELLGISNVEEFAREKLSRTISELHLQCEGKNIADKFSTRLISARTREGVDEFITEAIDLYQRHKDIEVRNARAHRARGQLRHP